jgi:WD40 repeat protein
VAFSPDGRTLVSLGEKKAINVAIDFLGQHNEIKLWDVVTATERVKLQGDATFVSCAAFSPDGKTLAGGRYQGRSDNGSIVLWDVASGNVIRTIPCRSVGSVAFSPDGKTLASGDYQVAGGENSKITLWDPATGEERAPPFQRHINGLGWLAFSPDGKTLVFGGVMLWDLPTWEERVSFPAGRLWALSPDGKRLASLGSERIMLWDMASGKELGALHGLSPYSQGALAFSPDGRTLATGGGNKILLWDAGKAGE